MPIEIVTKCEGGYDICHFVKESTIKKAEQFDTSRIFGQKKRNWTLKGPASLYRLEPLEFGKERLFNCLWLLNHCAQNSAYGAGVTRGTKTSWVTRGMVVISMAVSSKVNIQMMAANITRPNMALKIR